MVPYRVIVAGSLAVGLVAMAAPVALAASPEVVGEVVLTTEVVLRNSDNTMTVTGRYKCIVGNASFMQINATDLKTGDAETGALSVICDGRIRTYRIRLFSESFGLFPKHANDPVYLEGILASVKGTTAQDIQQAIGQLDATTSLTQYLKGVNLAFTTGQRPLR